MTNIFAYNYNGLDNNSGKITICSGPVIKNKSGDFLLHISKSTGKFQFIGGRLSDSHSLQDNAILRANEVLPKNNKINLLNKEPLCIYGDIKRNGSNEKIVLFHYEANLENEDNIGEGVWKNYTEILELKDNDMISSDNIIIAIKHFFKK